MCRASQHMVLSKLAMRRGAGKGRHLVRIEDFAKFLICIPAVILRSRSGKFLAQRRANLARGGLPGCEMAGWRWWLGESKALRA